jgi:hypothetical protein
MTAGALLRSQGNDDDKDCENTAVLATNARRMVMMNFLSIIICFWTFFCLMMQNYMLLSLEKNI